LGGVYEESMKSPHGVHEDSTRTPCRLLMDSMRTPRGLQEDSMRTPWKPGGDCKIQGIGWPREHVGERVSNKVFLDSESELELSEATVPGGSVASLWFKVFCSNK